MAINFGNTIMEGEITPSVAVQAPVQDNSGAVLAEALAPAARAVGQIAGTIFQQGQENANGKILTAYESDLLDLADAVDQGMDRNEAMIQARSLRREYLGNAPGLQTEFDKIWTNFATSNGLGHVVVQGTIEQQAQDAKVTEALKLGYPDVNSYDLFLARSREAEAVSKEVTIANGNNTVISASLQNRALKAVVGLADSAFPVAQTMINNAMAEIAANPSNKAAIVDELNLTLGQNINQLKSLTGAAGEDSTYVLAPITGLLDTFNQWSTGAIPNAVMEGEIKSTQLKYEAMFTNSPEFGETIAISKILGELGLQNTNLANALFDENFITSMKSVIDGKPVDLVTTPEAGEAFNEGLKSIAANLTTSSDPELVQEVMSAINGAVDGAYTFERQAEDGMAYKSLVEMLGSPEVKNAIEIGGGVSAQYADKFTTVLRDNYEQVLLPAISQFWEETDVSTLESIRFTSTGPTQERLTGPVSQFLQPVWNGSAVEFVPNEAYRDNPEVVSLANEVNSGDSSIGVPLNNLINAYANVTQVDAKTIWEQDFAGRLFSLGEEGTAEGSSPLADSVNAVLDATTPEPTREDSYSLDEFQPADIAYAFTPPTDTSPEVMNAVAGDGGILDFIGSKEAPQGYDQQYGGASTEPPKPLSQMTIGEVRAYQNEMVNNGSASSAVGKYQVIRKTMDSLIANGVVSPNDVFDEATQDKIAIGLLRLRGLDKWLAGEMSDEAFANAVAHEWASMPLVSGPNAGRSAYAGDGLNKSLTSIDDFLAALRTLKG